MAAPTPIGPDVGASLAMALIASSGAPLLLLDGELAVIAASASFCRAFNLDQGGVVGRPMLSLGEGEWNNPRLRSLLEATLSNIADIPAYEMDLARGDAPVRCLVLNAQRLVYDGDAENVRLLLTVTDVTEAREKDRVKDGLVRDKAILLKEVQHRVANSLQIIASVLMQSARKVQSEETRSHLTDAHQRVMSIAAVQQQLSASEEGFVELRPYFTQLCKSLGASMIQDHNLMGIDVVVDGSVVSASVSVSLGLVVTELVINALKHAFPDERAGRIVVDYKTLNSGWILSVSDNGVGMHAGGEPPKSGLGTSIVQALAGQLGAMLSVGSAEPGTIVILKRVGVVAGANDLGLPPRIEAV